MSLGTSIRIFLAGGAPDGLRLVEKANWTGMALVVPRSVYPQVRNRREFDRTGVYILRGQAESTPPRAKLYIGETDDVRKRIDRHLKEKDWWDDLIVFISKDENLNKAYVRHLEARLNEIASRAKRAELVKGQDPQPPRLSEPDLADAEGFLHNMLLIYPILGVTAFEEAPSRESSTTEQPMLLLQGKDAQGTGRYLPEGFVVYQGAVVRRDSVDSIHDYLSALRAQLQSDGVIQDVEGQLRFCQDYTFSSPSTAAGVLLGRSANGRLEWRSADGRTLKDIQMASLIDEGES